MPLSVKEALESYGFVGEMANAIPALKGIFTKAAREEWTPTKLNLAIRDSSWFKTYGEASRAWITLQATDPATARRNLENATDKVRLMMAEMGLSLSGENFHQLAKRAIVENLDDDQLRAMLARASKLRYQDGNTTGQAAEMELQMREVARAYGQGFTTDSLRHRARMTLAGEYDLNSWENLMRARAKAQYAHFAEQIDAGYTVRDIADPYISTMANTLEMSETDIDLSDKWVQRALQQRNNDGTSGAMPLWQFERNLKNDPRWDRTKQARDQAYDLVGQVGRDMGLVGS
jgi:hypothetical protein